MNVKNLLVSLSEEKKAAIVFVFASAISSGLNILTTPLFTRIMPVNDYGVISLYNSWYQVLYVIASFSVTNAVLLVGFHRYSKDRYGYLAASMGIVLLFSTLILVPLLIFQKWVTRLTGLNVSLLILMALCFVFLSSTQMWISLQKYEMKYKAAFWVLLVSAVISTACSLVSVMATDSNYATVKLWSGYIFQILIGIFIFIIIIYKGKALFHKEYWRFILGYNAPLLLHYLSQFVLNASDRIMIDYFKGEEAVAIYSLGYSVAGILLTLWYPVNSVLIPYMHKAIDRDDTVVLGNCFYKVLYIAGVISIVVSLMAPEIIWILGDAEYRKGQYVVPIVIAGVFFTVLFNLISNISFLFGKTHRIMWMTVIAAVMNLILNMIFIPRFGYIAAAYTTLASYALYAILHYKNMLTQYKKRFLKHEKLCLITGSVLLICICIPCLYELYILRYGMVVGIVMITFIKLKDDKRKENKLWKSVK